MSLAPSLSSSRQLWPTSNWCLRCWCIAAASGALILCLWMKVFKVLARADRSLALESMPWKILPTVVIRTAYHVTPMTMTTDV